jgi:hypothetical protein
MNEHEQQDINIPADEQLRGALAGVAGIFEQMFRRNDECRAEIEQIRLRHNQDVARMAALEMDLAADRAAIQQMGSVFAGIAQRTAPAPAAPSPAAPAHAVSAVSLLPPAAEHGAHDQQHTGEPTGHDPIGAAAAIPAPAGPAPDGTGRRMSSLTAADLVAFSRSGEQ